MLGIAIAVVAALFFTIRILVRECHYQIEEMDREERERDE